MLKAFLVCVLCLTFTSSHCTTNIFGCFRYFLTRAKTYEEKQREAILVMDRLPHNLEFWLDFQSDVKVVLAAITKNGLALMHASEHLKGNQFIVMAAVHQNGLALEYALPKLRSNKAVVLAAVHQNGMALQYAHSLLQNDRDVVLAAVSETPKAIRYGMEFINDRKVLGICLSQPRIQIMTGGFSYTHHWLLDLIDSHCPESQDNNLKTLLNDRNFVLDVAKKNGSIIEVISANLQADRKIVMAAVTQSAVAIKFASKALLCDHGIAMAAFKHCRQYFAICAYGSFRKFYKSNDRVMLLHIATYCPHTLLYLLKDKSMKNKELIIMAAVTNDGFALRYLGQELRNKKNIVLAAVKQNGMSIRYASKEMRADEDVVLAAVTQNGLAYGFGIHYPTAIRDSKEILLSAIKTYPEALEIHQRSTSSVPFSKDRSFMLDAISMNYKSLKYSEDEMRNSLSFMLDAVQRNGLVLCLVSYIMRSKIYMYALQNNGLAANCLRSHQKNDKNIMLIAIQSNGMALQFASDELRADRNVVLAAVQQNGLALQYASYLMKDDQQIVVAAIRNNAAALQFATYRRKHNIQLKYKTLASEQKYTTTLLFFRKNLRGQYIPKRIGEYFKLSTGGNPVQNAFLSEESKSYLTGNNV